MANALGRCTCQRRCCRHPTEPTQRADRPHFVDNAMVITQCKWIHTVGVKMPLDIAYLDAHGAVIKTERVKPLRISAPVSRCKTVVEARAGSFERWNLKVGDVIDVRLT